MKLHLADTARCRLLILLLALAAAVSVASVAQTRSVPDAPGGLVLADALNGAGAWDTAITEYKRYLYLHPETNQRDYCDEQIARAYWNLGSSDEALEAFLRAADEASCDSVRSARRLDTALVWVAQGEESKGELELARLRLYAESAGIRERASLHLVRIEVRGHRWTEARRSLRQAPAYLVTPAGQQVDSIMQVAENAPVHSAARARTLSTVLPGLGQTVLGAPLDGLHSLTLNGLLAWKLLASAQAGEFGSVLITASYFQRYYRGGRDLAARLALKRNLTEAAPFVQAVEGRLEAAGIADHP